MSRKDQRDNDVREALRSLLSDVEAMYQGAEILEKGRQAEEFFGPFSVCKVDHVGAESEITISWPNLAISMRSARAALLDSKQQK